MTEMSSPSDPSKWERGLMIAAQVACILGGIAAVITLLLLLG
jgi:hypothetical protein